MAPSSTDERLRYTVDHCSGFVYATAVMGVTGAAATSSDLAGPLVARTRAVTDLPVGVGLGVSNGAQAAEVAAYADGVIVGSAFVRRILDADGDLARATDGLRAADRGARGGGTPWLSAGIGASAAAACSCCFRSRPAGRATRAQASSRASPSTTRTACTARC